VDPGFPKGEGSHRKIFVGHMYKYTVFDIKPTYNQLITTFSSKRLNYIHQQFHLGARPLTGGRAPCLPLEPTLDMKGRYLVYTYTPKSTRIVVAYPVLPSSMEQYVMYASSVLCLSVCLSVTNWYCVEMAASTKPVFSVQASLTYPTQCFRETRISPKIRELFSFETFVQH